MFPLVAEYTGIISKYEHFTAPSGVSLEQRSCSDVCVFTAPAEVYSTKVCEPHIHNSALVYYVSLKLSEEIWVCVICANRPLTAVKVQWTPTKTVQQAPGKYECKYVLTFVSYNVTLLNK